VVVRYCSATSLRRRDCSFDSRRLDPASCTIRRDSIKARQPTLAGLGHYVYVPEDLRTPSAIVVEAHHTCSRFLKDGSHDQFPTCRGTRRRDGDTLRKRLCRDCLRKYRHQSAQSDLSCMAVGAANVPSRPDAFFISKDLACLLIPNEDAVVFRHSDLRLLDVPILRFQAQDHFPMRCVAHF